MCKFEFKTYKQKKETVETCQLPPPEGGGS